MEINTTFMLTSRSDVNMGSVYKFDARSHSGISISSTSSTSISAQIVFKAVMTSRH